MADDSTVQVKFGADTGDFTQGIDVVTTATKGYHQGLVDALNATNLTGTAMKDAAAATEGLNFATAGATQEYIRLGHELMTGNFSRIPGSMVVLANRMGGLQSITSMVTGGMVAWAAAIGAAAFGIYEWIKAADELQDTQYSVAGAFDAAGQSLSYNADQVERNIQYMREHETVSNDEAQKISIQLARISTLTGDSQNELIKYIDTWKQITGAKDNEAAAENLAKVFTEPAKAAEELARKYPGLISADQAWEVQQDEAVNGAQHAAEMLLSDIGPKMDEFKTKYLEPQVSWWENLKRAMVSVGEQPFGSNRGPQYTPPSTSSPADPAALAAQQHQQELNRQELEGLDIVNRTHGANSELNNLLAQREKLVTAANAAMEKGDDDLTTKYQTAMQDVDAKILAEKKRLNAEAVADAKRAAQQEIEIERDKANTIREVQSIQFQAEREQLQAAVDAKQITKQQELAALESLEQQEYNLSYEAYLKELQTDNLTPVDKQRIYDQIEVLYARHVANMAKLSQQEAQAQEQADKKIGTDAKAVFDLINRDMDTMLSGVLQGTQTWEQAAARLFDNLAISFIEAVAKMIVQWLAFEAITGIGGVLPWASPIANPFAGGIGGAILGSLDVGSPNIPQTGLYQLHQGEIVVPPDLSSQIRSGQASIGSSGASGGDQYNVSFTIQALDTQSGTQFLRNNAGTIAQVIAQQVRNNNSNLPGWKAA